MSQSGISAATEQNYATTEVAVVIVNYRTADLAVACLEAVAAERITLPRLRAIIVDGHSGDGSVERLSLALKHPDLTSWASLLALPINGGFGWANNQATLLLLNSARPPEFIYLLNPDAIIEKGALSCLVESLCSDLTAAAAGSQLLNPDGSPSGSAFPFPTLRREFGRGARTGILDRLLSMSPEPDTFPRTRHVDWVTGASVLLRSAALRQVGLFDDGFFLYHEETELMWRLRKAGWTIVHEPRSRVTHAGGAATGVRENRTEGKFLSRRPGYWYESRRRFFALTLGRSAAAAAFPLWLAGHLLFRLTRPLRARSNRWLIARELTDRMRHARPQPSDGVAGVVPSNAKLGSPPAWMREGR